MKKSSIVLLVFACIFATLTLALVTIETIYTALAIDAIYNNTETGWNGLGEALGGIFVYIYTIFLTIAAEVSGAAALPFSIILLKKDGKKWYNIVLLSATVTLMACAILLVIILPIMGQVVPSSSSSSSSSSASSSI